MPRSCLSSGSVPVNNNAPTSGSSPPQLHQHVGLRTIQVFRYLFDKATGEREADQHPALDPSGVLDPAFKRIREGVHPHKARLERSARGSHDYPPLPNPAYRARPAASEPIPHLLGYKLASP